MRVSFVWFSGVCFGVLCCVREGGVLLCFIILDRGYVVILSLAGSCWFSGTDYTVLCSYTWIWNGGRRNRVHGRSLAGVGLCFHFRFCFCFGWLVCCLAMDVDVDMDMDVDIDIDMVSVHVCVLCSSLLCSYLLCLVVL